MKKIITTLAVVALATTGMATDTEWTGATDNDWSTAGNWTNGVPGAADTAYVNSGMPDITVAAGSISYLNLGSSSGATTVDISADLTVTANTSMGNGASDATINQTAGNVVLGSSGASRMWLGEASGQTTYNLSGGTLSSAGDWDDWGTASGNSFTFNQTGGTYTDTGNGSLRMGYVSGSVAEVNVSSGTFNANNTSTRIGDSGSATMTLSANAVMNTSGNNLMVGTQGDTDPASTLNVQDDAIVNAAQNEFSLGHYTAGTGIMNVSGNGTVNQSGSALSIGRSGVGTLNLGENGTINVTTGDMFVGRWTGGSGTVNMSGGAINLTEDSGSTLFVGYDGDGAFYQTGGNIDTGRLRLCDDPDKGETGFYSISGGSLQVNEYISTGAGGVFEVYGSGATLIEASDLSVGGDTLRIVLDENGSTLITIDSLINPARSGQITMDNTLLELDTTGTFNGTIGSVYDLAWASDGIVTDIATVFSVLSDTDFEMSIVNGVDQFGNAGSGSMLRATVLSEPVTKILLNLDAATQLSGWDFGTHYGGGIANVNNVNFDGTAAIMTGQVYLNTTYSAPAVYVAASKSEFTGNFGIGNYAGSGWRIRLDSDVGDGAKFYSDNLFAVFNASFDAANDTLDASSIYSSDMAAISNGTIRFVVRDSGNWYISEPSPNIQTGVLDGSLTTSFSIEALSADWYAYDPTVNPATNGVADIGAAATPAFSEIDYIGFHLEVVAAAQGVIGTFSSCNFGVREFSATGNAPGSVHANLDATRLWLWDNPPGGGNRAERKLRTDVIDNVSTQLANSVWNEYRLHWGDDVYCDTMTDQHPVLHYLRQAELNAEDDIRNTVVEQGVVIWQMYNMGIIVKTPSRTFAMDLNMRDAQDLVDVLDFAVVSHEHQDHTMPEFLDAMLQAGKPVITPSYSGGTVVTNDASFQFGDITVRYKIGSHGGASTVPMGLCQVDCGPSGNDFVILHTGDGGSYTEFPLDKDVDLFLFHVEVGMDAPDAIDHVQARTSVPSHILELGHAIDLWRWLYSYAYNEIKNYSQDEAIVLSWGERWEPYPLDDSDGDRMPDSWETEHFGDISALPDDDTSDSDGFSNLMEYILGYDPNVADLTPAIDIECLTVEDIQVLLNTRAAQGPGYAGKQRRYRLEQSTTNLTNWTSVPGFEYILGDDTQKSYTVNTNESSGFYRADVWIIE